MNNKKSAKSFIVLGLAFIIMLTNFQQISAKSAKLNEQQKALFGVWQFRKSITQLSNQPRVNFLPAVDAPESLILAIDNDSDEITINESYNNFIQTNTLPGDGKPIDKIIFQLGKSTVKAYWKSENLILDMVTEKGEKITEKFELSNDKKQLLVNFKTWSKDSKEKLNVMRIYERVAETEEEEAENSAAIGITNYPF